MVKVGRQYEKLLYQIRENFQEVQAGDIQRLIQKLQVYQLDLERQKEQLLISKYHCTVAGQCYAPEDA